MASDLNRRLSNVEDKLGVDHSDEAMWLPLGPGLSLRLNMDYVPETEEDRVHYAEVRERWGWPKEGSPPPTKPLTKKEQARREARWEAIHRAGKRLDGLGERLYDMAFEPVNERGRRSCPICDHEYLNMSVHIRCSDCSPRLVKVLEEEGLMPREIGGGGT